jgi:hypothetical protein
MHTLRTRVEMHTLPTRVEMYRLRTRVEMHMLRARVEMHTLRARVEMHTVLARPDAPPDVLVARSLFSHFVRSWPLSLLLLLSVLFFLLFARRPSTRMS